MEISICCTKHGVPVFRGHCNDNNVFITVPQTVSQRAKREAIMHYLGNCFWKVAESHFALGFDQEVEGMGQQQDVAEVLSVDRVLL